MEGDSCLLVLITVWIRIIRIRSEPQVGWQALFWSHHLDIDPFLPRRLLASDYAHVQPAGRVWIQLFNPAAFRSTALECGAHSKRPLQFARTYAMHQAKLHCLDVAWSVIGRSTPVNLFWPKAREVMRNGSKLHGPVRGKFACLNLAYPLPFGSQKDSEKGNDKKNEYYRLESPGPGASS